MKDGLFFIRVFFALFVLFGTGLNAVEVQAQQEKKRYKVIMPEKSNYISDVHYQHMTKQLVVNPKDFSYDQYRRYYATSRFYDPLAKDAKEQMLNYAYIIQTSADEDEVFEARQRYDEVVRGQLANMSVVVLALSLSKEDAKLGNVDFFESVRNGLFKHVLDSGDGMTLRGAYDVITLDEETMLLNYLKVSPVQTTSAKEGAWYYNMHDFKDPKTGEGRTVFVNITIPMERLEGQQTSIGRPIDLRNQ